MLCGSSVIPLIFLLNYPLLADEVILMDVHLLRARVIQNQIVGDIHILVDPHITVKDGRLISEKVIFELEKQMKAKIIVHLEPYDDLNILIP